MSTTILQAPERTVSQRSDGLTCNQQDSSGSPAVGWLVTLRMWIERSRQRRALRELCEPADTRLKDVGISRDQARHEGAKRFWQQ
jgi:uncharacterized protein YjiS (DUF1127 family)